MRQAGSVCRSRSVLLTVVLGICCGWTAAAQPGGAAPPEPWPPELGVAFELYYAGDFLEVQRVCQQIGGHSDDPRLQREAAALAAMATMRLPGRDNRIEGRGRLAQLANDDQSLLTRPECQLAYGIAQTSLSATAAAIHHLLQAAEAFEAAGRAERLAETLVALAEAWARHGEWELTVPELDVPRPEDRAAADRIRRERIAAVRQRAAALPGCEDSVVRIDLILARHLLEREAGRAEAMALLEELAGRAELTKPTAQACLTLGEEYESDRHWADAARLYARVSAADLGRVSQQARERQRAIEQPHLVLEVPGQVAVGEQVEVELAVRNLAAVELEVRRVDLPRWLEHRQGRFAEAALPITGALLAVRDLAAPGGAEHNWWGSATLDQPLVFEAPAGALVVLARAADEAGNAVIVKQLVLAGDLRAAVFTGRSRAAMWVTRIGGPAAGPGQAEPTALFWMHGSFVPTRPRFAGDTAVFALPPEARLLRDKRWVCLVQAGEQYALCHGRLERERGGQGQPAVALVGGPPEARVGEQLRMFGRLLGGLPADPAGEPPRTVELELLDALDNLRGTATAAVSDADTFSTTMPITENMGNRNLRVAVRLDGQVLENVYRPLSVRVAEADVTPLGLTCKLPRWLPADRETIEGRFEAAYPWGTAAGDARISTRIQAMRLPGTNPQQPAVYSQAAGHLGRLNPAGNLDLSHSLSSFSLPEGPLAVGMWAEATGWDGRKSLASAGALIGPAPIHLWLDGRFDSPRVGEPLHVSVNWFDPTGRAAGTRPSLAVWRDGNLVRQLALLPAARGLRSASWRPTAAGTYELVATLTQLDGEPLAVRETIEVAGRGGQGSSEVSPLRCEARLVQHAAGRQVHIQFDGERREPMLMLLEAGDPLAARQVASLKGPTELTIPLPEAAPADVRLVLASSGPEGVRIVGSSEVRPGDDGLTVSLRAGSDAAGAGDTVEIEARCLRGTRHAADAILMARLVDVSRSGGVQWIPGEGRSDLMWLPGGIRLASSGTASPQNENPGQIVETRELSAQLARAYFGGSTLSVDSQPVTDGQATFTFSLPSEPGFYRLVCAAQTPGGAFASETLDLDTRHDVQLRADVPERLMLGDRTIAALTITNPQPVPLQACVTFDGGAGLHADEWCSVTPDARLERPQNDGAMILVLPPGGAETLRVRVEAGRCGPGTAAFVVESERGRRRATASYDVCTDDAADDGSPTTIRISRKLFLLEEAQPGEEQAMSAARVPAEQGPQWLRFEIEPGERVAAGRLVLVQEEFSLTQPLSRVDWEQRLPGNCHTHSEDWDDFRRIGPRRTLRLQSLGHHATRLGTEYRHIHEYVIVPVRPGACRFPRPTVRAGDAAVGVEVESAVERVIVVDSH